MENFIFCAVLHLVIISSKFTDLVCKELYYFLISFDCKTVTSSVQNILIIEHSSCWSGVVLAF